MFIPDGYPTFRADVTTLFGTYLPRHGILSDLIANSANREMTDPHRWGGGEVFLCSQSPCRVRKHLTLLKFVFDCLIRCRKERYDAVQIRDAVLPALIGCWVARRERIPFFYWMSYPMYESHITRARTYGLSLGLVRFLGVALRGYLGKWLLYRFVLPASDHVFVQSQRMMENVAREGIAASKLTPVPMGADLEEMDASRIEPMSEQRIAGRRVVTYLGTLARVRRVDFLFEVLAKVKERIPQVVLVLAGDAVEPEEGAWLRQRAREAGIADDVIWTGWLAKADGWRFVRASEIALSPIPRCFELDNGSVTKVVEYLALNVPTVCNDQPDQAQVIRESDAGLCVAYSAEAFANAIVHLLENPREAAQMGARGRPYVAAHRSYEKISGELATTYAQLLRRQFDVHATVRL